MTRWTPGELDQLTRADELVIFPATTDETPRNGTPIWMVVVDDALYVRAYRGRGSRWFSHALQAGRGRIEAGGLTTNVTFTDAQGEHAAAIDRAYRTKYSHYSGQVVDPMAAPDAHDATLRVEPAAPSG
ncbi:DUF2255 family protein [Streptomyces sp. NPDC002754]